MSILVNPEIILNIIRILLQYYPDTKTAGFRPRKRTPSLLSTKKTICVKQMAFQTSDFPFTLLLFSFCPGQ